jgi:hypothetical protein
MNRSALQNDGDGVGTVNELGFLPDEYGTQVGLFDLGNLNARVRHNHDILGTGRATATDCSQQQDNAADFAHESHDFTRRTLEAESNLGHQHVRVILQAIWIRALVVANIDSVQEVTLDFAVEVGVKVVASGDHPVFRIISG